MRTALTVDDRAAKRMMEGAIKGIVDPRPAFKKMKSFQLKQIDEAYKVSGKNIAGPWKKLSPGYLKSKIASGFLANILVRTGSMRSSHRQKALTKKELSIQNTKDYFKDHQLGEGKSPRRQVHGHSSKMIQKALDIYRDYIIKLARYG